jgi:hypothetical protein
MLWPIGAIAMPVGPCANEIEFPTWASVDVSWQAAAVVSHVGEGLDMHYVEFPLVAH